MVAEIIGDCEERVWPAEQELQCPLKSVLVLVIKYVFVNQLMNCLGIYGLGRDKALAPAACLGV